MNRLAMLSVHGCPLARLGERDTGGMNVYILQVSKELGKRGYLVDIYTRCHDCDDPPISEAGSGVRVIHVKAGPYSTTKDSLYRYLPEFLGNLYAFQIEEGCDYDIIHSHYWLSGYAGLELSSKWDVPHIMTFHTLAKIKMEARLGEMESRIRVSAESRLMESVDSIVVSTTQEREDLARLYGVTERKVSVVPAGVDIQLFRKLNKADSRSKLGLEEHNIILSVGRMEPIKGFDILLKSVAMLGGASDTRLVIVGGDENRDSEMGRLESLAAELGVLDLVTFAGAVDQTDLPVYYSAADIFVLPTYYESFGLVALEAMACGLPVVASRLGGLRSFIEDGVTGYLIPWHRPEVFADTIADLLADKKLQERMGAASEVKARTMGWDITATRLSEVYSSAVNSVWERAAGV